VSLRQFVGNITALSSVNVVRLLAQFFAIPILSRLLSPSEYGVVGMATPFLIFGMMIADAGIGMSLVRVSANDRKTWSTCFWLSLLFGVFVAGIMAGFSPLAAVILGEPRLGPIVLVLAITVLAQAGSAVPGAALQQSQRFNLIAGMEMAAVLTGIATAFVIAIHGGGAWALVGQQLAFFAVRFVLVMTLSGFRPRLMFDWNSVREHLVFGRNVLGTNMLSFFSKSADNLVIGKVLGPASVGLYAMGVQFAALPGMVITGPLQYIVYSQLARIKDDKDAIRRTFMLLTRGLALGIFPMVGLIAAAHDAVFSLMLSAKWSASGELFMIVAPVSAMQAVTALGGTVMMVIARTDIQLRASAEFGFLWLGSLLVSVWFGVWWVAIAYNCAVLLYLPRLLRLILPLIGCSYGTYLGAFIIPAISTSLGVCLFLTIDHYATLSQLAQVGSAVVIAVTGIGASAFVQRRALMRDLKGLQFARS
jgi:O-antigen/teichoic acid export membrane protein